MASSFSLARDIIRQRLIYFGVERSGGVGGGRGEGNIDAETRPTMEQLILLIDSDQRPTNAAEGISGLCARYTLFW